MDEHNHIVVYRNQWEADADMFYHNHPEIAIGLIITFFLFFLTVWGVASWRASRHHWGDRFGPQKRR